MAYLSTFLLNVLSPPTSVILLLVAVAVIIAIRTLFTRDLASNHAPARVQGWASTGSLAFLTSRVEFLDRGKELSRHGQFSFWYGTKHVVAVSGLEARASYLTSRGLDAASG